MAGRWFGDASEDVGLQTSTDFRFYTASAKLTSPFQRVQPNGKKKPLVFQYSVKHEQRWIECGGGYMKLLVGPLAQDKFDNLSPAAVVFGPDLCGTQTKDCVVQFGSVDSDRPLFKNSRHIRVDADQLTHFFTLILQDDDHYKVLIDGKEVRYGSLVGDLGIDDEASTLISTKPIEYVGFELWQVRAGSLFDNIIITDDIAEADAMRQRFEQSRAGELRMWQDADKLVQEEERRIRKFIEEERARQDKELHTLNERRADEL